MIGTTAAIIGAAAIGAVGSVASGAMAASAANSAANAQVSATEKAIQAQKESEQQARQDSLPWMEAGKAALNQYMAEIGVDTGSNSEQLAAGSKFTETPGYKFDIQEGEKGVVNNLAALGLRRSGSALKALTDFRVGLAEKYRGQYLDRLSGAAGMGQQQSSNLANISLVSGANQAQSLKDIGNAKASGYIGAGNAWSQGISGAAGNIAGGLGYLYGQNRTGMQTAPSIW